MAKDLTLTGKKNPYQDLADFLGVPLLAPVPLPVSPSNNQVISVCGACGQQIMSNTKILCGRDQCPVQVVK